MPADLHASAPRLLSSAFVLAGCRYCDGREDAWEFPAGDVLPFCAVDAEDAECGPGCAVDGRSRVNGYEAWVLD